MKLKLVSIGKAHEAYVKNGIDDFTKRIAHYYPVEWHIIPVPKNAGGMPEILLKKREGEAFMEWLKKDDYLVALDERGALLKSEAVAELIEQRSNNTRHLVFLIGGAFGLDEAVLKRANFTWSLSLLVFPHQLVRLILAEQLYRACTILRHEKYHHS